MSTSAARTLDLMAFVAASERPLGLMELVEQSGLDKSTAGRLLSFLVQRGFLNRDPVTKRYTVGPAFIALGAAALNRWELKANAAAHLRRLCEVTGETSSLHLRVGDERICVAGVESSHPVRRVLTIGERVPLHASPTGKVILAFPDENDAKGPLAEARVAGSDVQVTERRFARIREQRHMIGVGDRTPGVGAVSVPLFEQDGTPVASLTIAGPADRWTPSRMEECLPLLRAAAEQICIAPGVRTI